VVAKPIFDVLAELLQLRLKPALGVLQFLDPAIGLAKRFFKSIDAQDEPGRVTWLALRAARNVGGRRRLSVKNIELRLSWRRNHDAGDEGRSETGTKRRRHWNCPGYLA
jgi:hypothetical protein